MENPNRNALKQRVLHGPGKSSNTDRVSAFENQGVPEPAAALIDKVAKHAYKVTDEDVAAVKQSLGEDEIFELVVCAAVGAADRQLQQALYALGTATGDFSSMPSAGVDVGGK